MSWTPRHRTGGTTDKPLVIHIASAALPMKVASLCALPRAASGGQLQPLVVVPCAEFAEERVTFVRTLFGKIGHPEVAIATTPGCMDPAAPAYRSLQLVRTAEVWDLPDALDAVPGGWRGRPLRVALQSGRYALSELRERSPFLVTAARAALSTVPLGPPDH